jgi:hypothetical protein
VVFRSPVDLHESRGNTGREATHSGPY